MFSLAPQQLSEHLGNKAEYIPYKDQMGLQGARIIGNLQDLGVDTVYNIGKSLQNVFNTTVAGVETAYDNPMPQAPEQAPVPESPDAYTM